MTQTVYTVVTFAPVQGFIQKSRKLRDLYGSSFIVSYLAKAIYDTAQNQGYEVVSPGLINLTQGTPNQIIIAGNRAFSQKEAKEAFLKAWKAVTKACQQHIETLITEDKYQRDKDKENGKEKDSKIYKYQYDWQRNWNAWTNYAWEFFHAAGETEETITNVRQKLNQIKYQRAWIGVNWTGESSTLSGGDGVAWYGMATANPKEGSQGEIDDKISGFYRNLSKELSNSIIDENEQLSIPELIKRLITLRDVAKKLDISEHELPKIEIPLTFKDINRKKENPEENRYTGWFQGDGDKIGDYLQRLVKKAKNQGKNEAEEERISLKKFSQAMMNWGEQLKYELPQSDFNPKRVDPDGRIIYAGGDDFLGVLYRNHPEPKLMGTECLQWFYRFQEIWEAHKQKITVSVGFVWAAPGVPQRDVLQHCHEAEQSAKHKGRSRLAIRILYNNGNHIEWVCPWWWLKTLLTSYQDKEGDTFASLEQRPKEKKTQPNWTHFFNDVATLESRHAFNNQADIALALFEIYFGQENREKLENPDRWWNNPEAEGQKKHQGIFGEIANYQQNDKLNEEAVHQGINDWVINLAKVGFHLYSTNNEQ